MGCWSVFETPGKLAIMGDVCAQNLLEFLGKPQTIHVCMCQ